MLYLYKASDGLYRPCEVIVNLQEVNLVYIEFIRCGRTMWVRHWQVVDFDYELMDKPW